MSGHRLPTEFTDGFSAGSLHIGDPGDTGVFVIDGSHMVCEITTTEAGGETRVLPDPEGFPVGTEVTLILNTDGGDCVITQEGGLAVDSAANTQVTFADVGDLTSFMVISRGTTKYWHITWNSGGLAG